MVAVKANQIRLRITDEDFSLLQRLADDAGLSITDIGSLIIHAAARSISSNNNRLPLPLRFRIVDELEAAPSVPAKRR